MLKGPYRALILFRARITLHIRLLESSSTTAKVSLLLMYHVAFLLTNSLGVQIVLSLLGLMSLNRVHLGCSSLYLLHLETDICIYIINGFKALFFLSNLGVSFLCFSQMWKSSYLISWVGVNKVGCIPVQSGWEAFATDTVLSSWASERFLPQPKLAKWPHPAGKALLHLWSTTWQKCLIQMLCKARGLITQWSPRRFVVL